MYPPAAPAPRFPPTARILRRASGRRRLRGDGPSRPAFVGRGPGWSPSRPRLRLPLPPGSHPPPRRLPARWSIPEISGRWMPRGAGGSTGCRVAERGGGCFWGRVMPRHSVYLMRALKGCRGSGCGMLEACGRIGRTTGRGSARGAGVLEGAPLHAPASREWRGWGRRSRCPCSLSPSAVSLVPSGRREPRGSPAPGLPAWSVSSRWSHLPAGKPRRCPRCPYSAPRSLTQGVPGLPPAPCPSLPQPPGSDGPAFSRRLRAGCGRRR